MSPEILFGFVSIGFLVIVDIVIVAYSYGKLCQKVADACRRITRMERIINHSKVLSASEESD